MVINTVGPTWEGNQVWFILGGGAIFAAWPFVYAASFSGFYLAMFLVLASLILRPVGFKYRSKRPGTAWRARWDWALFVGGIVPPLVFGVAVGNVLQGIPLRLDSDLRSFYEGGLLGLFTPFTLLCGLLSVAMVVLHGAVFPLGEGGAWRGPRPRPQHRHLGRPRSPSRSSPSAVSGSLSATWASASTSTLVPTGPSNPMHTTSVHQGGAWLTNYGLHPWMMIAPILGFAGAALALLGIRVRHEVAALAGSSLSAVGIIATVGLSMFPYILPSTVDANSSLTVWNASSSPATLFIMVISTVIFLPLILIYTAWVYKVMWGRVTAAEVSTNPDFY